MARPPWANRPPDLIFDPRTTTPEQAVAAMKLHEAKVMRDLGKLRPGDKEILETAGEPTEPQTK
jgi:hypothetical protein